MKKVYAFVAALTTAFSLTACGNTNEESISSSVANSITEISETETVEYESNSDLSRTDVEISKENISDAETSVSYEESANRQEMRKIQKSLLHILLCRRTLIRMGRMLLQVQAL